MDFLYLNHSQDLEEQPVFPLSKKQEEDWKLAKRECLSLQYLYAYW